MALPYVVAHRGPYAESAHQFSACVATANGELLGSVGDVDRPYPIRSLAKPFIAAEFVRCGAADAYRLGEIELALAAGSHDGEPRHVTAIRAFLAKAGFGEDLLLCGPAIEGKTIVGPPAANNCSGKHAAALVFCRHLSLSTERYIQQNHPLQQRLTPPLLDAFGRSSVDAPVAVDGCGFPVFGASLRQVATAYARLANAEDPAMTRVRDAMVAEPGYVGGWFDNLDTRIISWSDGAIVGKIGAEGLHADAIVGKGIGIAVKVHDGNSRALGPVLAHLFLEFIPTPPIAQKYLAELAAPPVLNAAGQRVGDIRLIVQKIDKVCQV